MSGLELAEATKVSLAYGASADLGALVLGARH